MFTSENTRSFPGIFPGIFGKIFGEIFREFSEFRKIRQNFPEIFLDFTVFCPLKKIDFSSVALYLHRRRSLNFRESSGKLSRNLRRSPENFQNNFRGVYTNLTMFHTMYVYVLCLYFIFLI